jgi:hypothetical protein
MESNVENENLSPEDVEQIWNEEAAKLDADDNSSAPELLADVPNENSPQIQEEDAELTQQTTEPEPEPDPLAGLSDGVRAKLAEIDELKQANANLLHHVKTTEGRVAAMQREAEQARRAQQTVGNTVAPSQGQIAAAAKNPEKWDQLKEDFPEWGDAVEEFVNSRLGNAQQQNGLTSENVANFVEAKVAETRAEMTKLLEEARVEGKYEDWKGIVNTPDFAQWYAVQNPQIRALADSTSSKDALKMLDLFHETKKRSAADIKQEREQRLAAAATTKPGNTPPPKTLDDMSPEELWNYEAAKREKTKAQRGF